MRHSLQASNPQKLHRQTSRIAREVVDTEKNYCKRMGKILFSPSVLGSYWFSWFDCLFKIFALSDRMDRMVRIFVHFCIRFRYKSSAILPKVYKRTKNETLKIRKVEPKELLNELGLKFKLSSLPQIFSMSKKSALCRKRNS